jgi:hypothetical protein
MTETRKLKVFLCHASQDKHIVRELYQRLNTEGWIDPWLDQEKLLPGQDWNLEIEKAVEAADAVIVCLSNTSVSKEGYIQRELKFVLDIALEKPEGTIFVVPLRLDDCELPRRLRSWQAVDYFPVEQKDRSFEKLLQSLRIRYEAGVGADISIEAEEVSAKTFTPPSVAGFPGDSRPLTILLVIYFLLAGFTVLGSPDDVLNIVVALSASLTGILLLLRRKIPGAFLFKISGIAYFLLNGLNLLADNNGWQIPLVAPLAGISAIVAAGVVIGTIRIPKKPAIYTSIFFAIFLFLFALEMVFHVFGYYPDWTYMPIIIAGLISAILLWFDY